MANIFNARVLVHPSYIEPDLIVTTSQASGFMDVLAERALRVKLGPVDKFVYQNRIDLRSQVTASQAAANALPSATLTADYVQTGTYRVRTRAEYNELDIAEAGEWNVALPQAQRLALRQGIFQYLRVAALFGVNAANYEGLLNTPNSTQVNLPPDTYGNTTVTTYDAGQLAQFFLNQINQALQRMFYLGAPNRIQFLGPQRIIGQMQLTNIVQVTSYQRPGAGTATTAQIVTEIAKEFGYAVEWAYDDTLAGVGGSYGGAAGSDVVLLVVPEAIVPNAHEIDTNVFQTISPVQKAMTLQYADVAAPTEVTTPIVEGLDVVAQIRISSGWAPRGQAVTVLTLPH